MKPETRAAANKKRNLRREGFCIGLGSGRHDVQGYAIFA